MNKALALILTLICLTAPAWSSPVVHVVPPLYQAYTMESPDLNLGSNGYCEVQDVPVAVPGFLDIIRAGNWGNYIAAAMDEVDFTTQSITLIKRTPGAVQECTNLYPASVFTQIGDPYIRTWWSLMYEAPGTKWTLIIDYDTNTPYDDDGDGPNEASLTHTEEWRWQVKANLTSLGSLVRLFHQSEWSVGGVPLIGDDPLYYVLLDKLAAAQAAEDQTAFEAALGDFSAAVMDACVATLTPTPAPSGPGTGIAQTDENPACCKLLADVDYILSGAEFAPVAIAEVNGRKSVTLEATGPSGVTVNLDSSQSYDPGDTAITRSWDFETDGTWDSTAISVSHTYAVSPPDLPHAATLRVTNALGKSDTDVVLIKVVDTVPPVISDLEASPSVLPRPGNKLIPVTVTATVSDTVDPTPACHITSVTANEPMGESGTRRSDWRITGPLTVDLREVRPSREPPRIYTIHVVATDASGNETESSVDVIAPHNRGGGEY